MGSKLNLPKDDEFLNYYNEYILKESELKSIIDELYRSAELLKIETYNERYEKIKVIDNNLKFLYKQMEGSAIDKINPQQQKHEEFKKQKLVEVKKRYLSLIEEYMKIPIKIFSTIKLEIK